MLPTTFALSHSARLRSHTLTRSRLPRIGEVRLRVCGVPATPACRIFTGTAHRAGGMGETGREAGCSTQSAQSSLSIRWCRRGSRCPQGRAQVDVPYAITLCQNRSPTAKTGRWKSGPADPKGTPPGRLLRLAEPGPVPVIPATPEGTCGPGCRPQNAQCTACAVRAKWGCGLPACAIARFTLPRLLGGHKRRCRRFRPIILFLL